MFLLFFMTFFVIDNIKAYMMKNKTMFVFLDIDYTNIYTTLLNLFLIRNTDSIDLFINLLLTNRNNKLYSRKKNKLN